MLFDTGSANFWVPSVQCVSSLACITHKKYNYQTSSTYSANGTKVEVEYGSSNVTGVFDYDTVSIAGLVAKKTLFLAAT